MVRSTFVGIGQMINGTRDTDELGGPIRIAKGAGEAAQLGLASIVFYTILLSLNLGLINLFPIPVLDGGHIMMSLFEKVRGKPLGLKFVEYTTTAFAVLLISFMLYVSFYDVKRIPLFRTLFNSEVQVDTVPQPAPVAPAPAKP